MGAQQLYRILRHVRGRITGVRISVEKIGGRKQKWEWNQGRRALLSA
jgi:hypothetical protein